MLWPGGSAASAAEIVPTVHTVWALHKLTARVPGKLEPYPTAPARLRAVRGEWESFQAVVQAGTKPLRGLYCEPGWSEIPASAVKIYREHYVHVPHPSGNARLDPLWWPDALFPSGPQERVDLPAGQAAVFYISVKIGEDWAPGLRRGKVWLRARGWQGTAKYALQVERSLLPPTSARATAGLYYDALRQWHARHDAFAPDDAGWSRWKKIYYEFLLDFHLNAYDLPVPWASGEAENYLRDTRVHSVRLPALDQPEFKPALETLRRTGHIRKAFYYWWDEPGAEQFPAVHAATRELRRVAPEVPHLVTAHPHDDLRRAVDIWCPNIGDFTGLGYVDWQELARERRRGRETWWYTMVEPRHPSPTWLVDDSLQAVRVYGWMMARWGLSGLVYSMVHGWGPRPLEDLTSFAGTAGDGTLIYPARPRGGKGPLPSLRLMALRDALEDYELLVRLDEPTRRALTGRLVPYDSPAAWRAGTPTDWQQSRDRLLLAFSRVPTGRSPQPAWLPGRPVLPALVQPKTPARLSHLVKIDGRISPGEWPPGAQRPELLRRFASDKWSPPRHRIWLGQREEGVAVGLQVASADHAQNREWLALECAPRDGAWKRRLVLTRRGRQLGLHATHAGITLLNPGTLRGAVRSHAGGWEAELLVPWQLFSGAKRMNLLVRLWHPGSRQHLILRLWPDGGDLRLMPVFETLSGD